MKDKKAIDIKGLEEFLYIPTTYEEDDDLDSESLIGEPTGIVKNEESPSVTTDIPEENNPTFINNKKETSTGRVIINKSTIAASMHNGDVKSGHTNKRRKSARKGIVRPGDNQESNTECENGKAGIFSTPIEIPYRTFSQNENGIIYHYVILHSDEDLENVRLHFLSVGEESEEELFISETNVGVIKDNKIQDLSLTHGRLRLKVRFEDNLKHSVKLSVEEYNEIQ